MEELYVEGVATHGSPESCVVVCKGGGEALTGARAGRAIEPRNVYSGVPTLSERRKATSAAALSRGAVGPRVVKNQGMYGTSMRENREIPRPPIRVISGRDAQGTPRRSSWDERVWEVGRSRRSAGINRHGGGDGRALRRRSSDPRRP